MYVLRIYSHGSCVVLCNCLLFCSNAFEPCFIVIRKRVLCNVDGLWNGLTRLGGGVGWSARRWDRCALARLCGGGAWSTKCGYSFSSLAIIIDSSRLR